MSTNFKMILLLSVINKAGSGSDPLGKTGSKLCRPGSYPNTNNELKQWLESLYIFIYILYNRNDMKLMNERSSI